MIQCASLEDQVREKLRALDYSEADFLDYVKAPRLQDVPPSRLQWWIGSLDTYLRRVALRTKETTGRFP